MFTKLRLVFPITIFFACFYGYTQTDYWQAEAPQNTVMGRSIRHLDLKKAKMFSLEEESFKQRLQTVDKAINGGKTVYFPDEKGTLIPFWVTEASVLSPTLAAKYPGIKSYRGYSLTNKNDRIRFSVSHRGVQSMIVHTDEGSTTFMQKTARESNRYVVYNKDSKDFANSGFICRTRSDVEKSLGGTTSLGGTVLKLVDDQVLRRYRIAVSATGEYTAFHGGTVADALAAINATLTRVNEVFETDLAVTLELVANTDQVIFTDAATDPYTGSFNSQVQNTLTSTIGETNYDVGHLFHQDTDNGNAGFIGSVCRDGQKGSAFSSGTTPEGDTFDLDFVGHELGHQFGANHTWSFESEGTSVQAEPASGTTIMGYAGIAPGNNVAPNGDDYFHYYSIFQIIAYLGTTSCAVETPMTNNPPVIAPTGNFMIPRSTAFVLTGNATDPDGNTLTYAWEQIDDGVVTTATFGPTNPSGANFRSRRPSLSPERYFPQLARVVQGNLTQTNPATNSAWETVSDVAREMNFALTVRDNANGGGQVASDLVQVQVENNAGPFVVTSQATNETYVAGSTQDVLWDVAQTDKAPINAQMVDILLSTDGGASFPISLAEDVPNDGDHTILLPATATTNARIMIRASDNIFFAVNASNFTIEATEAVLDFEGLEFTVCQSANITIPFVYETNLGFNEQVTFSATNVPAGLNVAFSPTTATADGTPVDLTFSNTAAVAVGNYPITITASSASITQNVILELNIYDTNFSNVALTAPADGLSDVTLRPLLQWGADPAYTSYDVEIATDPAFASIVESVNVIFGQYQVATSLQKLTTYYWRVKPKNNCGEGVFGTAFSFTTIDVNCKTLNGNGLPLEISTTGTPTVTSTITFLDDRPVADVNISLDIAHSFLADLVISLTSPQGTTVVLTSKSCGNLRDINATFDDEAAADFVCGGNPGITGTVKPLGFLSSFNGESLQGNWTLQITDTAPADGGALNGFSLEICVEGEFRPDADGDGVFDDGDDLCLGTPPGTEVGTDGCPVFRFPPDNFTVTVQSETCSNNNDGSIQVDAVDTSLTYSIVTTGNGVNDTASFTDSYLLENLSAGTYMMCITGTDGTNDYEEFCLDVVINEPQPLSVSSQISVTGEQLTLTMQGGSLYNVELNGIMIQTSASEISLDLIKGVNTLKVSTNLPCQGTFEEQFFTADGPIVAPNPFDNGTKVFLGLEVTQLRVSVHTADGRLVSEIDYTVNGAELDLDFVGLPSGMYFVRLDGNGIKETFKVLKR